MRAYDNGALFSVSINESEIDAFRRRWPASGLHGLTNLWAQFDKRNGDLVDLQCNRRDCHRYDGEALKALVDDMQKWGEEKMGLKTSHSFTGFSTTPRRRK